MLFVKSSFVVVPQTESTGLVMTISPPDRVLCERLMDQGSRLWNKELRSSSSVECSTPPTWASRLHSSTMRMTGRPGATSRPVLLLRSEEHTSELQSRRDLVCRLLLEKK